MPSSRADREQELVQPVALARVEAGGRLVEAEQQGPRAHRARDLEPPLIAIGQRAGRLVGAAREPDPVEPMPREVDGFLLGLAEAADAENGADGEPEARISTLCCATIRFSSTVMPWNSRMFWKVRATRARRIDVVIVEPLQIEALAVGMGELHQPFGRLVEAGDAVEHRGLAGAVRPDQRGDVVAADRERDVVDGEQPAEAHGQVLDLEQGSGLPRLHALPSSTRSLGIGARLARARSRACACRRCRAAARP